MFGRETRALVKKIYAQMQAQEYQDRFTKEIPTVRITFDEFHWKSDKPVFKVWDDTYNLYEYCQGPEELEHFMWGAMQVLNHFKSI